MRSFKDTLITESTHPYETVEIRDSWPGIMRIEVRPDPGLQVEGTDEHGPWVDMLVQTMTDPLGIRLEVPSMSEEECESLIAALQRALDRARQEAADRGWEKAATS